jgi:coenzyme F420-reducing hydrogenase gamma subunit
MTTVATAKKPRLAVFKFASCDGCQLQLLDAEARPQVHAAGSHWRRGTLAV